MSILNNYYHLKWHYTIKELYQYVDIIKIVKKLLYRRDFVVQIFTDDLSDFDKMILSSCGERC